MRLFATLLAALVFSCGQTPAGTGGSDGKTSLVKLVPEAGGAHCPAGGTSIQTGLDANGNGALDADEVTSVSYVCSGAQGASTSGQASLIAFDTIAPGTTCPGGGTLVKSGLDLNDDGTLQASEVTASAPLCDGAAGAQALVKQVLEPAGANCPQGGLAVKSGPDTNANGALEDSEVAATSFVCNGAPGATGATGPTGDAGATGAPGAQALVSLTPEPPGVNCATGGTLVSSGLDTDGDGTLDAGEVTQKQYVCSVANVYKTGWSVSAPGAFGSNYPVQGWYSAGRKVGLYKTNPNSRLKVTVNDSLRVGSPNAASANVNGGWADFAVRMNEGSYVPGCYGGQYTWNAAAWNMNDHLPLGDVCLTAQLPVGYYEFELWVYSAVGDAYVGAEVTPLVMVEEVDASLVGTSMGGADFSTTSATFVQAPGRTVTYTKKSAGSLMRLSLSDTYRAAYNVSGGWSTLMIRQDGADTTCSFGSYDATGTGQDFHLPLAATCLLENVAAGAHTYTVWAKASSGAELYLGWHRYTAGTMLVVEEVPNTTLAYKLLTTSVTSGELSSLPYALIPNRTVTYTPSAAGKSVKVTWSDTFRNNVGCNGSWGSVQLFLDGAPTGCVTGKFTWVSSGAPQDHHAPLLMTCVLRNLAAGSHTFELWHRTTSSAGTTACGTNSFGWNRGQALLMVEELP